MKNIRKSEREPIPFHPDFLWMKSQSIDENDSKSRSKYLGRLREMSPDFGILRWGHSLGKRYQYCETTHAHIFWIKDVSDHGKVSEILSTIKYKRGDLPHHWMGEVSFEMADLVEVYDMKKQEYLNDRND